jgi:hypothetical protein
MCCGKNRQQFLGKPSMNPATRTGSLPPSPLSSMMPGAQGLAPRVAPTTLGMPMTTPPTRQNLPRAPQQTFAQAQPPSSSMALRYLRRAPIRMRGPATGRLYDFSGSHPVQPVDSRDATALLRTHLFGSA